MPKFSPRYAEEIKSVILICRARGYRPKQTQKAVNDYLVSIHSDKVVSESFIHRTIESTRHEANDWLRSLTNGKYEYIDLFKTIIERLNMSQNELWDLVDERKGDSKKDLALIKAYTEIHSINKTLWELYKDIPLLASGTTTKSIEGIVMEDTTSVYPEISTQNRFTSRTNSVNQI